VASWRGQEDTDVVTGVSTVALAGKQPGELVLVLFLISPFLLCFAKDFDSKLCSYWNLNSANFFNKKCYQTIGLQAIDLKV
jgi:hypothetical protein